MAKEHEEFNAWRKAEIAKLPETAARVFALRGTGYYGSGFQWGLEKQLGYVIHKLNDYDDGQFYHGPGKAAQAIQTVFQTVVKCFYEELEDAEWSAKNGNKKPPERKKNR